MTARKHAIKALTLDPFSIETLRVLSLRRSRLLSLVHDELVRPIDASIVPLIQFVFG